MPKRDMAEQAHNDDNRPSAVTTTSQIELGPRGLGTGYNVVNRTMDKGL